VTQHGERVLEKYAVYLEAECRKAGDDEWRIAQYHRQQTDQVEDQTKGLRQFLEGRKPGRPRKDTTDQLYQEIATLHHQAGVPRVEIIQLIRKSNIKLKNPSEDVRRALKRYPDNKTLAQLPKREFFFLEIQQLQEKK